MSCAITFKKVNQNSILCLEFLTYQMGRLRGQYVFPYLTLEIYTTKGIKIKNNNNNI